MDLYNIQEHFDCDFFIAHVFPRKPKQRASSNLT